jgi:hypothetical protein
MLKSSEFDTADGWYQDYCRDIDGIYRLFFGQSDGTELADFDEDIGEDKSAPRIAKLGIDI